MSKIISQQNQNAFENIYQIDDCVYLSPPDSTSESFYIGRIIEILPSNSSNVKIAWFYRPKDILKLNNYQHRKKYQNSRLLLASMNSDINPISSIKGKCFIQHLDDIPNLESYISQPDCFYYNQLHDKYTNRNYSVLPLSKVHNLPSIVLSSLVNYKYILVEEGKESDFMKRRICAQCHEWCNPNSDVVSCVNCKFFYHLSCADMNRIPSKGYAWECSECLKKTDSLKSENKEISPEIIPSSVSDSPIKLSKKDSKNITLISPIAKPAFPFRYFGEYSKLEDLITDTEGRPKAASRLGKLYQATDVPDVENLNQNIINASAESYTETVDTEEAEITKKSRRKDKKKLTKSFSDQDLEIHDRGIAKEITFSPSSIDPAILSKYMDDIHSFYSMKSASYDLLEIAMLYLHIFKYNADDAFNSLSKRPLKDLLPGTWTQKEIQAFEQGIIEHGQQLDLIQKEIPTKTIKEVVLYFYKWKKSDRYIPVYLQYCKEFRPNKSFKNSRAPKPSEIIAAEEAGDESDSVSESELASLPEIPEGKSIKCAFCSSENSDKWKPRMYLGKKNTICLNCHIYYMKYGTPIPQSESLKRSNSNLEKSLKRKVADEELPKKRRKREPAKKKISVPVEQKEEDFAFDVEYERDESESETEEDFKTRPCAVCNDSNQDHINLISTCSYCKLRVHQDCYGLAETENPYFCCARCSNIRNPEASVDYQCVLCPTILSAKNSALKKTIGNNWVHLNCAIWTHQVKFGDVEKKDSVECIGLIPQRSWNNICTICFQSKGIAIKCNERNCSNTFHISCAGSNSDYQLSIEPVNLMEDDSRLTSSETLLNGMDSVETLENVLETRGYCAIHAAKWRNQEKEKSKECWNLISEFVSSSKRSPKDLITCGDKRAYSMQLSDSCSCHMGTRLKIVNFKSLKNEHLDALLRERKNKECMECETRVSPIWWIVKQPKSEEEEEGNDEMEQEWLCQSCSWDQQQN